MSSDRLRLNFGNGPAYDVDGWTTVDTFPFTITDGGLSISSDIDTPGALVNGTPGHGPTLLHDGYLNQPESAPALLHVTAPVGWYNIRAAVGTRFTFSSGSRVRVVGGTNPEPIPTGTVLGAGDWLDQVVTHYHQAGDTFDIDIDPEDTFFSRLNLVAITPVGSGANDLVEAVRAQLATIAYIGPVYRRITGFTDQGAIRLAGTVTLPDATKRLRLVYIQHQLEMLPSSMGTFRAVHAITVNVMQLRGGDQAGDAESEVDIRDLANVVVAICTEDRIGEFMQLAVGDGWEGLTPDGVPKVGPTELVEWQGDTWHRATVDFRVSEEVDRGQLTTDFRG